MQSTLPEPSPLKPGRRVLGDKTTNASLTPAVKRIAEATAHKSSTTAIPFNAPSNALQTNPQDVSPDARHAGQKRTIDQVVEDIESEPRKVFMTSQSEGERGFKIFDEETGKKASEGSETSPAVSTAAQTIDASATPQQDEAISQKSTENKPESSNRDSVSRVPTEPVARKIFIQQKAILAKARLQSAMRRAQNQSLDRALSQFEAAHGALFQRDTLSSSSYSSSTMNTQQRQQAYAKETPAKQERVLLPPLPLQARSRPVRPSAQKPTPSSSGTTSNIAVSQNEEDDKDHVDDAEDDNDKTPKALSDIRQKKPTADSEGAEVAMSQASDSVMEKLVKWTQSSTDSNRPIET